VNFFRPMLLVLLVVLLAVGWWRWRPEPGELRRVQLLMGTTVEILAEHPDAGRLDAAVTAAFAELTRCENLFSSYLPESEISRLSQATTSLKVSAETAELLALGLQVARDSQGAFDMGLGRLKQLWGLDGDQPRVPAAAEIAAALAGTGPQALQLEGSTVHKRSPQLAVDLGGIAKGYAVDRAIQVLKAQGVTSAAINAGGDMYLLGQRHQRPWRIGIQHPRQADTTLATLTLTDRAVVTSGDYERYFEADGQRYHHLFDPKTGTPARRCQSVTVVSDSVALADALATALFVLGPTDGLALLAGYPGSSALIVAADGQVSRSPNWPEPQP